MKNLFTPLKFLFVSLVVISMTGCFQYPDGPFFTVQTRDERLAGNWAIDEVTNKDGVDVTSEYLDYTLFAEESKEGNRGISLFKSSFLYSFGTYSFADHSDYLIVVYTTYEGVDVSKEVVQKFLDIRRLTDKWLWYIDENGIEYHWKKY